MTSFERNPESLTEAIGPMVYGMDVDQQIHNAKQIEFAAAAPADIVHSAAAGSGLDKAENEIRAGDAESAGKLAPGGDPRTYGGPGAGQLCAGADVADEG